MNKTEPTNGKPSTQQIPLFPLSLVLFPGGRLPLKVFEQRYVDMTKACLRDNTVFGVCLIRHGNEVGEPAEHESTGCSARITNWDMPHTGLFVLDCGGEQVFRVLGTHHEKTGLIVGEIEWLERVTDPVDPLQFEVCRAALQGIIDRIGENFFTGAVELGNPDWVSYRLAEVLAVDAHTRQSLLEQDSAAQRLATLLQLLQPA